jgi:4-amino-4-deoxy-L-arabinose transferase-like glycosyltransferase
MANRLEEPPAKPRRWLLVAPLILVLLAAAWLRLWRLPVVPPGFWYDEAYNAMEGLWTRDTLAPAAYFTGDMGRDVLMSYLLAVATAVWGVTPLACRLVNPLVAMLLLALLYRWLREMFVQERDRHWVALMATTGLAFSIQHVVMSRTAYEPPLGPLFLVLMLYLFWRGWRAANDMRPNPRPTPLVTCVSSSLRHAVASPSWRYFIGAGISLGLGVYSNMAGRLTAVALGLFAVAWTAISVWDRRPPRTDDYSIAGLWRGMVVTSLVGAAVLLPLWLFIRQHPGVFLHRIRDVFILTGLSPSEAITAVIDQLVAAVRVFWDNSSPNWRHGIPDEASFDWFSRIGFLVGLPVALSRLRRPSYLLLLICLGLTWLPALLSKGVSTMRLAAMLPIYYTIAAIGLLVLANLVAAIASRVVNLLSRSRGIVLSVAETPFRGIVLGALLVTMAVVGGADTAHRYFVRWAEAPEVYQAYDGRLSDVARFISTETYTTDVLLPFGVYTNPSMRFLLYEEFSESDSPPVATAQRPAVIVRPPGWQSSVLVWLSRDHLGRGQIYVPRVLPTGLAAIEASSRVVSLPPSAASVHEPAASLHYVNDWSPLRVQLTDWSKVAASDLDWGREMTLVGYEVWPKVVQPGRPIVLTMYWRCGVGRPLAYYSFVQLVSGDGKSVTQSDHSLSDRHRWRPEGLIPDQHTVWLGPEVAPGPYVARIGLFDADTGQRIPILSDAGRPVGDQTTLGLFYVAEGGADPRWPDHWRPAHLGDSIKLLGYSVPTRESLPANARMLRVQIHWQTSARMRQDYTAFVQLLDAAGRYISGSDHQPLNGEYPTSRWAVGDVVVDAFQLLLPADLPAGEYRLVTGMYDPDTGQRLPATGDDGSPLPDNVITLTQQVVP